MIFNNPKHKRCSHISICVFSDKETFMFRNREGAIIKFNCVDNSTHVLAGNSTFVCWICFLYWPTWSMRIEMMAIKAINRTFKTYIVFIKKCISILSQCLIVSTILIEYMYWTCTCSNGMSSCYSKYTCYKHWCILRWKTNKSAHTLFVLLS